MKDTCLQNEEIIKIENVSFSYDDGELLCAPAVSRINLSVRRGEYLAILGHNGSGKSTLAKLLNLILTPSEGKICIDGVDVTDESFDEDGLFDIRRKVGMVFQNPDNQLVATVVEEDVAFGPENLGIERKEIRRRIDEALSTVRMSEYARHAPHKLSGGQKQRVAIAGVIAMKPEVIIFDESTAMLDPLGRRDVVEIMERLNREDGITVINITHYMEEAARADRIVVMNDGKIIMDGEPREIFSRTDELHGIGLEAPGGVELINLINKSGGGISGKCLTEDECVRALFEYLKA